MSLNSNKKMNYNSVVKLLVAVTIIQTFLAVMFIVLNLMFYRANFNQNINNNTQIVNIDNSPKYEKVDINTCSYEVLDNLKGIGEVKANEIIKNRPYEDIYQVKKIIGEKTFENIKNHITVGGKDE